MKVILAGLDQGHLRSDTNGYAAAAQEVGELLVSFFFFVDPASHAGLTTSLIPQLEEQKQ